MLTAKSGRLLIQINPHRKQFSSKQAHDDAIRDATRQLPREPFLNALAAHLQRATEPCPNASGPESATQFHPHSRVTPNIANVLLPWDMNRFRKLGFIHYAGGIEGGLQVHSSLLNVVLND
ncbi:MAG: hypothetical protein DMG58_18800 [Acidobacteria bacterium]|nr:MAG: hypothetical protein DMG58_18800 [Acidobacteriota bacterium]